ncbi:unnamed protein product [Brassica oleracea var. botrytis]|uniref:BnaC06g07810D protein n=4 Tax=Brassica TaxID=3705 RepID=A0A078FLH7_BRANA|nr:hypothetical protein HID58_070317 [Brassica napus]CAF2056511.1 unnamed protein product [Brassica napus]CDY15295.1 BnaC06g07810D [Brassica napus]VDD60904.1 unnamed protein product [Brassica oleracea]
MRIRKISFLGQDLVLSPKERSKGSCYQEDSIISENVTNPLFEKEGLSILYSSQEGSYSLHQMAKGKGNPSPKAEDDP